MHIIGLTGGIASGKSTVSTMLAELGAYIIDADEIARAVVLPNQPAWHEIVAHFGSGILMPDGKINREILGKKIFSDQLERQNLERFTHPYIEEEVQNHISRAKLMGESVVVLDVPLLFEKGWNNLADEIWVVYVGEELQLTRLMARNDLTLEQGKARIQAQMSLTEKIKQADVVIDNNVNIEETRLQVIAAWNNL